MKHNTRIPATFVAVRTHTLARRGFLLCALFSLAIVATGWSATADSKTPVSLDQKMVYTGPGLFWTGTFTGNIGDLVISGTTTMTVVLPADKFFKEGHCTHTFYAKDGTGTIVGTIVAHSKCNFETGIGHWRVESATGIFEGFNANGSQTFPSVGGFDYELLDGFVTGQN